MHFLWPHNLLLFVVTHVRDKGPELQNTDRYPSFSDDVKFKHMLFTNIHFLYHKLSYDIKNNSALRYHNLNLKKYDNN